MKQMQIATQISTFIGLASTPTLDKVQYLMQSPLWMMHGDFQLPGNQINLIESFINWLL